MAIREKSEPIWQLFLFYSPALEKAAVLRLWDWNNLTKPRGQLLYMADIKQEQ